jgi:hypothetical protein
MRTLAAYIAGALTGLSVLAFHLLLNRTPAVSAPEAVGRSLDAPRAAAPADPAPAARELSTKAATPAAARPVTEPPGAGGALPDAAALGKLLDARALPALRRELERLLGAGMPGHRTILEFLRAEARPPRLGLRRQGALGPLLLSVALRKEAQAADCCRFLLAQLDPVADAELRRHLVGFLPVFLAAASDPGPGLRRAFEEALLADLARPPDKAHDAQGPGEGTQTGDAPITRPFETIEDLGDGWTLDSLEPILSDPSRRALHPLILRRLASRGDAASLEAIVRHVEGAGEDDPLRLGEAFQALASVQQDGARAYIEKSLASEAPGVRQAATLAYFSSRRGSESLPVLRTYLASDSSAEQKTALVWRVRGSSPEVFAALEKDLGSLPPEVARAIQVAAIRGANSPGARAPAPTPRGAPPRG